MEISEIWEANVAFITHILLDLLVEINKAHEMEEILFWLEFIEFEEYTHEFKDAYTTFIAAFESDLQSSELLLFNCIHYVLDRNLFD